jgi:hypothetical protein
MVAITSAAFAAKSVDSNDQNRIAGASVVQQCRKTRTLLAG